MYATAYGHYNMSLKNMCFRLVNKSPVHRTINQFSCTAIKLDLDIKCISLIFSWWILKPIIPFFPVPGCSIICTRRRKNWPWRRRWTERPSTTRTGFCGSISMCGGSGTFFIFISNNELLFSSKANYDGRNLVAFA